MFDIFGMAKGLFLGSGAIPNHDTPTPRPPRTIDPPWKMQARRILKVKLKSLVAEVGIIRQEEAKTVNVELLTVLRNHRVHDIRIESRATHLAYNFIRGRTYAQTENKSSSPVPIDKVKSMVKKYAGGHIPDRDKALEAWFSARSEG